MEKQHIQILLPKPFNKVFEYYAQDLNLELGDVVKVPFGKSESYGVVWSLDSQNFDPKKVKQVITKAPVTAFSGNLRKFITWVAGYTLAPLGSVLAMAMSVDAALEEPKPKIGYVLGNIKDQKLTAKRQMVVDSLCEVDAPLTVQEIAVRAQVSDAVVRAMIQKEFLIEKIIESSTTETQSPIIGHVKLSDEQQACANNICQKVSANVHTTTVLDGVTGSGKTEVYFEAIATSLEMGKQVLILLPEIALTTQLIDRFYERFGFMPTSWHSALTQAQRRDNWREIASGKARLIIGARSALFLPYPDLGLIIVDEEHESAFKQEDGVVYHGRDMAVARAFIEDISAVLVSASPSLETIFNIGEGKYDCLHLTSRHGEATLPDAEVVDMRTEKLGAKYWLSTRLKQALTDNLEKGEQSLLYLNRRGYAPLTLCRTCGYRFQCPECTSWLVAHKPPYGRGFLQCHHCGLKKPLTDNCPDCGNDTLASCGPGVERLQEEVREFFPHANVAMMTSDTISDLAHAKKVVTSIEKGEVDIIIGTQMIAKGYNFKKLTLVGVVDADLGLDGGDLRAAERSYQLLHQVSGRAGRYDLKGRAIFQTYMPDNLVMEALLSNDRDDFNAKELSRRERSHVPPYSRMAALIVSGKQESEVYITAKSLAKKAPIDRSAAHKIRVLGPAPAPLLLLRGNYRYRLLVMADRDINIQNAIRDWLSQIKIPSNIRVKVDIDPYSFI